MEYPPSWLKYNDLRNTISRLVFFLFFCLFFCLFLNHHYVGFLCVFCMQFAFKINI